VPWALGDHAGARVQLNQRVKEVAALTQGVPYWVATAYVMLGEDQEAFEWLERAINIGNENLPWFKNESDLAATMYAARIFQDDASPIKPIFPQSTLDYSRYALGTTSP